MTEELFLCHTCQSYVVAVLHNSVVVSYKIGINRDQL